MNEIELLQVSPIVPVVVLDRVEDALPLAEALLEGGIGIMEITLRSAAAMDSIEIIARDYPQMNVGAGTVTDEQQMLAVRDAGGGFSFSPGNSESRLSYARQEQITYVPGVATASEVMLVMNSGIEACKLFPATAVGGVELLKGFAGPFTSMQFCPTGGIGLHNLRDFLSLANVLCVGGSWIVPRDRIADGDFAAVTKLCREALAHLAS